MEFMGGINESAMIQFEKYILVEPNLGKMDRPQGTNFYARNQI